MKKILIASVALSLSMASLVLFQLTGCTKTTTNTVIQKDTITKTIIDTVLPVVCDVRGRYTGTDQSFLGGGGIVTYFLKDNNQALSSVHPTDPIVSYGGYRNTCDSVIISVFYSANSKYYLMKARISNDGSTLSGKYYSGSSPSQTNSADSGTFTMSKF